MSITSPLIKTVSRVFTERFVMTSYLLFSFLRGLLLLNISCAVAMETGLAVAGFGVGGPAVLRGSESGGGGCGGRHGSFSRRWRERAAVHGSVHT